MPDFSKFLNNFNPKPENRGGILVGLNVASMVLAAASNVMATMVDKNTSKEDKKFLAPAGVATGVANIGIYYLLTTKIIKKLEKAAQDSLDATKSEDLAKNTLNFVNKSIKKAEKGFLGTGLFKKSDKYIESMKSNFLKDGNVTDFAKETFKQNVKGGAGILGAFIGAFVGCSIITPIIRDVSAYIVQKKMEKKNPELSLKDPRAYFEPIHLKPAYNKNLRKGPVTFKNYPSVYQSSPQSPAKNLPQKTQNPYQNNRAYSNGLIKV